MSRVRLVAYRKKETLAQGTVNGNVAATTGLATIPMSFTSGVATDFYFVGDTILNSETQVLGVIDSVTASSIVLAGLNFAVSTNDTLKILRTNTYNLDLQEQPNISLNFQFADIKEPEKRKASYSQTFKLPFTDANNEFFENWYNVNAETLVFNTHRKFDAVLYVGTVPQFEGVIQLKAVFKKAGLYEVVLLSNGANLFTLLGNKKVFEAWTQEERSDFYFTYNYDNLKRSWDGSNTNFTNLDGVSFRDADAAVQKVMFPMQVSVPDFYYPNPESDNTYLSLENPTTLSDADYEAQNYIVPMTQFKPAIQLRTVLKQIFNSVGFTYTSTFLDSVYFGRLFMTTCNHLGKPSCETLPTPGQVDGQMLVAHYDSTYASFTLPSGTQVNCFNGVVTGGSINAETFNQWQDVTVNTTTPSAGFELPTNENNLWSTSLQAFHKTDPNMATLQFVTSVSVTNMVACSTNSAIAQFKLVPMNSSGVEDSANAIYPESVPLYWSTSSGASQQFNLQTYLPIVDIPTGSYVRIYIRLRGIKKTSSGSTSTVNFGGQVIPLTSAASGIRMFVNIVWDGLGDNVLDRTVDTIAGIDTSLTQKAFIKDLIQRFNLVFIPDNDNPTNLKIEPYNDFVSGGEIKNWSNKLDLSKEIVIKDTTSLQKSIVDLSDADDVDLLNKTIADFEPTINVFGNINTQNTNNEFAQGEFKYKSPFAPYINQQVWTGPDEPLESFMSRMLVQYEFTYKQEGFSYTNVIEKTKPKLYYYSGQITNPFDDATQNYYMHEVNGATGVITARAFNDFPLCTPYEITVAGTNTGTIDLTTKSLHWSQQPPLANNSVMFSGFMNNISTLPANSLYFAYWSQFFNLIYNKDNKIVECHLDLNEVDIFDFKFSDEIFIKDKYYRILDIKNYQVGEKVSSKVTMITANDDFVGTCLDCDFVLSSVNNQNTYFGYFIYAPSDNPTATPILNIDIPGGTSMMGLMTSAECCECNNGQFYPIPNTTNGFTAWLPNTGICKANTGSLPIQLRNLYNSRNLMNFNNVKSYVGLVIGGYYKGLSVGSDRNKYSFNIVPEMADDIKIKYNANIGNIGVLLGESHRLILLGKTSGNTKGFAYSCGTDKKKQIKIPINSIVNIRLKGISTVVGGYSSTYPLGSTEAFAYYTAFSSIEGQDIKQLGTANGTPEYALKESGVVGTCTMEIDTDGDIVRFGIKDADADAKRTWQISVDYDVNIVPNVASRIDANDAQFQNLDFILLQNEERLQWN
tara:strand:+ start:1479 stop:5231 length:3753 start_codon:yes stop_codon:yes gene_type:complete